MDEEEKKLLNKLKEKNGEANYLATYLKSGISDEKQPLYEYLKNDVFEKNFYVPKDKHKQEEDEKIISTLFDDAESNVLVFRAHGGSGKTTYLKMLEKSISKKYECLHINLASNSTKHEWARKVSQIIFHNARKYLNTMLDPKETQEYSSTFEEYSQQILKWMKDNDYYEYSSKWEEIVDIIIKPENKKVAEQIERVMRSLVFEEITKTLEDGDELLIIQMSCLFLVNLLLANSRYDRFLVIFDNVEAIILPHHITLSSIIVETFNFLSTIYNALHIDFCTKINFLISIRTTTRICLDNEHADTFWGTNGKYIHDVDYEDFCAEALLKKLKFLHKPEFKETNLYKELYLLCSLLCSEKVIKDYLDDKITSDTDYKFFTRETLAPFFGNNFRLVVLHLADIITKPDIQTRISELIKDNDHPEAINGSRGILMFQLFKNFSEQNIFSYFGIENISGKANHSMTRVLLSFLYWDKYRQSSNENYKGTSLLNIVDIFYNVYNKEQMCAFIDLIYKLSPYSTDMTNDDRNLAISKWSYMVLMNNDSFSNVDIDIKAIKRSVEKYLEEDSKDPLCNIKITISDAAFCFRGYISNHFEFLNARNENIKKSLFMYGNEKNEDKYEFQFVIEENIHTLKNFIDGMINEVVDKCPYKKNKEKKCCSYCNIEENMKKHTNSLNCNNIFLCSLYIRYIEVSEAVINAIDYVDRYRRYLWGKYGDIDINLKILGLLKKYGDLLTHINLSVKDYKKFDEITSQIGENFRNNNISSFHMPRSAYYFKAKNGNKDLLFEAIDHLELPQTDQTENIYDVCNKIKDKVFNEKNIKKHDHFII